LCETKGIPTTLGNAAWRGKIGWN